MADDASLKLDQYASFDAQITYQNVDITNWVLRCQFRRSFDDTVVDLDISTTGGGLVITDATNGVFQFNLTPAQTANLTGKYVYDIVGDIPGGAVVRIVEGAIIVQPAVTRT